METIHTIGKRKSSVARIFLKEGRGKITVNRQNFTEYFPTIQLHYVVKQPLVLLNVLDKYDITANIIGGGHTGQAEALRLAISRALLKLNPENKKLLKEHHLLTRDARKKERKKAGFIKARKQTQYKKR